MRLLLATFLALFVTAARAEPVCIQMSDVYELALADIQGGSEKLWEQKVKAGECGNLPVTYIRTLYTYKTDEVTHIAEFVAWGQKVYGLMVGYPSGVWPITYQPEYNKAPDAVKKWFKAAAVKGGYKGTAYQRLGIVLCCEKAERLRTKFVGIPGGEWLYYPDPACVVKGCLLLPIPDDVVHESEIHAVDPADDALVEFEDMRREGVLFIWNNKPSCFWYPRESGG